MRYKVTNKTVKQELEFALNRHGEVYSNTLGKWIPMSQASFAEIRKDLLSFCNFYIDGEKDHATIDAAIKEWMVEKGYGTKSSRTSEKEMQKGKEKSAGRNPNESSASSRAVSWFWKLVVFVGRVRFGDSKKD